LQFSADGAQLFTGSKDKSFLLVDLNSKQCLWKQLKAHESAISAMLLNSINSSFYTGDDDGVVKIWDTRSKQSVGKIEENSDFISEFVYHDNLLLAASGDGTLSVYDVRKSTLKVQTEPHDDEFLSLAVVKNGKKVVCGTQAGNLNIFTHEKWEEQWDRFAGHPESIDSIVVINEDIICTGSSDGLIRVVSILPNQLLGVIGEHEDLPIERLALSRDKKYIASCSHDNSVKFWNVSFFFEDRGSDSSEDEIQMDVGKLEPTMETKEKKTANAFFSDL